MHRWRRPDFPSAEDIPKPLEDCIYTLQCEDLITRDTITLLDFRIVLYKITKKADEGLITC